MITSVRICLSYDVQVDNSWYNYYLASDQVYTLVKTLLEFYEKLCGQCTFLGVNTVFS